MDKTGGGTLTCGNESGKSLTVKVTSATQSVTVTAVPEDGYVFVKWSDGVTKRTRTDTNFDQNVDVTAVFAALPSRSAAAARLRWGIPTPSKLPSRASIWMLPASAGMSTAPR